MKILSKKSKIPVAILITLMLASIAAIEIPPANAQLEHGLTSGIPGSQGWHGTTAADRAQWPGIPNLGPLPSGVTPQYTITSLAYLSFTPNPIGKGQMLLVNVWTSPGMYHAFYMQGYAVTIQKPDGTTETISGDSYMADATAWFNYIPDQVGTYRLKFDSPGTYLPAKSYVDSPTGQSFQALQGNYSLGASVLYTASSTEWQNLTVQENYVAAYPGAALPTDYWSRPIYPDNREWYSIAGNYPFTGRVYYANGHALYASNYKYTAYVQAPNTCHIVWRKLGNIAGLLGGEQYQYSLSAGPGTPNIIFDGRCYQTISKTVLTTINGTIQYWPSSVWECYDLRTGEVFWDITGVTAPTFISYEQSTSEAVPGAEASQGYSVYLVAVSGGRLIKYNPYTGAASTNVSIPVSSATVTFAPYMLSLVNYGTSNNPNYRLINWSVSGSSTNFTTRIISNITFGQRFSYTQSGVTTVYNMTTLGSLDLDSGLAVYAFWATPPGGAWCIGHYIIAADLRTGQVLWIDSNNDTTTENIQAAGSTTVVNRGKIAFGAHDMAWSCWNARTGQKLWTSEKTTYPWGAWFPYNTASYDFNETTSAIVTSTYEGVYAIDWDTGKILWHFADPTVPFEDPYGGFGPFFTGVISADGKVYAYNGEHTPSQPLTRDWRTFCINATTGEGIWEITGPMTPGAVADGYLTAANSYDGYMYVFGKGKTSTTITSPDVSVAKGTGIEIKGSVLDISPGMPNTPCVSKDSMKTQMEYLYEQKTIDGIWHNMTITGVPVTLTAIDSDNNVIDIGTTTTNGYYGVYGLSWTPPKEGHYTIMASFAGDDSYGSSAAATTLSVGPAPTVASPTATSNTPTNNVNTTEIVTYLVVGIIAIIVAIAIVGAVLYRKK